MKSLTLVLLALLASGCDDRQSLPKEVESAIYLGVKLPGRASDAKAAGFTDCTADYYGFACRKPTRFDVLGVSALQASVSLTGRDAFTRDRSKARDANGDARLLPQEALSYDQVALELSAPAYDDRCVAKVRRNHPNSYNPPSCLKPGNSIEHLKQALEQTGWKLVRARRYSEYLHPNEGVSITLQDNRASISRVDPNERSSALASVAARQAEIKVKEAAGEAFVEQMAK
jgi:hypothetical protein